MKRVWSILSVVLWIRCCNSAKCPPVESLKPHCWCYSFQDGGSILCQEFKNPSEVVFPIEACQGYNVTSINIHNSTLTYLPRGIFQGTTFAKVVLYNTVLMSLSNGPYAFEGLEDSMVELRASKTEYTATWQLSQLQKLKKMYLIDINNIILESVEDEFTYFPELTYIGLSRADLSYIGDKSFALCPKLNLLDLSNNHIEKMKRSMFPMPAAYLTHLRFDGNDLMSLPQDFFTEMPSLQIVNLSNNKFITISENPFSKILRQLENLEFAGNPLHCDCRMTWLVDARKPHWFDMRCESPPSLKGKMIRYLTRKDLAC